MKNETEITVGYVALEHAEQVAIGERRSETRRQAKLVALKVRSVETDGMFIEPVEEIALGLFGIRGITPVSSSASNAAVPHLEEPEKVEITREPVQSLGLVRTRENKLVLADLGEDEVALPNDDQLVGVVPAPAGTFSVNVYDGATNEEFRLGFHINGTAPRNWVELALARRETTLNERRRVQREKEEKRRQAAERTEQDAKAAQKRKAEETPVPVFETTDPEVAARLREAYRFLLIHIKKSGGKYFIEDVENRGPAIALAVQNEREELRKQGVDADKYFGKKREEYVEALAAR
jgi:hypothetical protein